MNDNQIFFYKGNRNVFEDSKFEDEESKLSFIRTKLAECFDIKHLSFLLGSGCSSSVVNGKEVGIPTMKGLAAEFAAEAESQLTSFGFDLHTQNKDEILANIERYLELLFSLQLCVRQGSLKTGSPSAADIETAIGKAKTFLRDKCLNMADENSLIELYQSFYRKLLCRDRQLPRVQIFTTNYDVLSEVAMDRSGIMYWNGFSGTIERKFNPSTYKFVVSERLDLRADHWSTIDNFILLFKLHGSLNWLRIENASVNEIREVAVSEIRGEKKAKAIDEVMIYPTPGKVGASLSTPYADLFREFQSKLSCRDHILTTVGYGFGDEHVNNLLYQALSIPSFRLVVFSSDFNNLNIKELLRRNDPRIWIIGGTSSLGKLHYFGSIVDHLLPDLPENLQNRSSIGSGSAANGQINASSIKLKESDATF